MRTFCVGFAVLTRGRGARPEQCKSMARAREGLAPRQLVKGRAGVSWFCRSPPVEALKPCNFPAIPAGLNVLIMSGFEAPSASPAHGGPFPVSRLKGAPNLAKTSPFSRGGVTRARGAFPPVEGAQRVGIMSEFGAPRSLAMSGKCQGRTGVLRGEPSAPRRVRFMGCAFADRCASNVYVANFSGVKGLSEGEG